MSLILGIDPGFTGALAAVEYPGGRFYGLWDFPTFQLTTSSGKNKTEYNLPALWALLNNIVTSIGVIHAALEVGHPRPKEGVVTAFSIGRSMMLWEAYLTATGTPYSKHYPASWKRKVMKGMSASDKGAAIARTLQLFPAASKYLLRQKDHGRAEALLLANYQLSILSGGTQS